ncbi:MAG: hypothetical protein UX23_C0008G0027 [Parcubacteria group bacterium GW2011_GWB1_45_9]|nr:MAG: hypothetical protein UX23_C0008G0027 [Parcubacteria group bacterium GW2011_GWB1_45_9]
MNPVRSRFATETLNEKYDPVRNHGRVIKI